MSNLPILRNISTPAVIEALAKGFKIAGSTVKQVSPHIKVAQQIIVENVPKKAEYAADLMTLVETYGLSVKKAAEVVGTSVSYAYKLLKK